MTYDYNYFDQQKEETYLTPKDTTITIDGFLQETENIQTMNGYAEYSFTFNPRTMYDHQMLMEHLEQGKNQLNELKPSWSRKVPELHHIDKKKQIVCCQLFKPSLNISFNHHLELFNRIATITLHLRDDPQGLIYLNAEYINVHPQPQPQKVMMELVNGGDNLEEIDF